ncbi:MAG TPA: ribonuclease E inhibitor RraB [Steroidobacteraceae bacterium]
MTEDADWREWPQDADGDVLRSLEAGGFDFSKPALIDFNVDFGSWPPPAAAIQAICKDYPSATMHEPNEHGGGYVQFQVYALVTYELVTGVQSDMSEVMAGFGGECCSWGVLYDPSAAG